MFKGIRWAWGQDFYQANYSSLNREVDFIMKLCEVLRFPLTGVQGLRHRCIQMLLANVISLAPEMASNTAFTSGNKGERFMIMPFAMAACAVWQCYMKYQNNHRGIQLLLADLLVAVGALSLLLVDDFTKRQLRTWTNSNVSRVKGPLAVHCVLEGKRHHVLKHLHFLKLAVKNQNLSCIQPVSGELVSCPAL